MPPASVAGPSSPENVVEPASLNTVVMMPSGVMRRRRLPVVT